MDVVGIIVVIIGLFGGSLSLIAFGFFILLVNFNVNRFKR